MALRFLPLPNDLGHLATQPFRLILMSFLIKISLYAYGTHRPISGRCESTVFRPISAEFRPILAPPQSYSFV